LIVGEDKIEQEEENGEVGEYVDVVEAGEVAETSCAGSLSLDALRKLSPRAAKSACQSNLDLT
jgi:hypothetical protein